MKKILFLSFLITLPLIAQSQYRITGVVQDQTFTQYVAGARITLFTKDTIYFRETRTDASGKYSFVNVPANTYSLGIAKLNKEYRQETVKISSDSSFDFGLLPETQQGKWDVIVKSPEALGGTDLGILLPNGNVFYCHDTKDPFIFNFQTNDTMSVQGDNTIQGCAAPLLLPDGKIIFVGGADRDVYGPGTRIVKTYDYLTGLWQKQPNIKGYRWYPSMTRLTDGKLLVTGGGTQLNPQRTNSSEIYNPIDGTSQIVDTTTIPQEQSPILQLYNGKVLMTHRPPQLYDPSTQQWNAAADFLQGNRMPNGDHADHELVQLPEKMVVAIGYRSFTPGVPGKLIEKYSEQTNTWTYGANSNPVRSRPEVILLPGKNILVMAGYKEDILDTTSVNKYGMMNITDIYNPYTDQWRRLARMNYFREYHALATLVPDGRVIMVGGEGEPGNKPPQSIIEAFTPPSLFRGVRPEIMNFIPKILERGSTITFDVIKTDSVTQVILMSTTSVTHMMNCGNNRYVELDFIQTGNTISAHIPSDSLNVLNGYYQLIALVDDIPSVSKIIQVGNAVTSSTSSEILKEIVLTLYPNPALQQFTVELPNKIFSITVTDVTGRIIYAQKNISNNIQIDSKDFPAGMYVVQTRNDNIIFSKKIIICK